MPAPRARARRSSRCACILARYSTLRVIGGHLHPFAGLEIDQQRRLAERRLHLLRIEHVEEHDLVAVKTQRLDGPHDVLGVAEEVGDDHDHAAAPQELPQVIDRLREVGAGARLGELEAAQEPRELSLPHRRPDVVAHVVVEHHEAGRIALAVNREVEERRADVPRVVHLGDGVRGVLHGVAGIEQDRQQAVRLAAVAFQVGALGPREHVPVHVTQIVAGRVRPVLRELLAEPEIGGSVEAGDEAVHDRPGDQVEA